MNQKGKKEKGPTEIIPVEPAIVSLPQSGLVETELARIEQNIELFNRVKRLALKLTKPSDWVLLGDTPYLMDKGAENIAIAFGVDIFDVSLRQEWAEDEKGRYYYFVARGKARSKKLDREIEDIGVCSQRDRFFGMLGGELKELAEVDIANIQRKAVVNLYNRLIKRIVGLTGVTLDDLKEAGINLERVARVTYKSSKTTPAQKENGGAVELSREALKKREEIWLMLLQLAQGNQETATRLLEQISTFIDKQGKEHRLSDISKLTSEKWINILYQRAKELYEGGEK